MTSPIVDHLDIEALRELCSELLASVKALEQRVTLLEKTTVVTGYPHHVYQLATTSATVTYDPMRDKNVWMT